MFIIEELIKKAKEGDNSAIAEIINNFKYFIMKEASKYHIPAYEFEDLVQHGYLSVVKAVRMYKEGSNSFNGYCLNAIKRNYKALLKGDIKHFRENPTDNIFDINTNTYEFTIEDQIIAYIEIEKLYKVLDKLPHKEREIIERFYLYENSLKEIACDMELNYYDAVKIKGRALDRLKYLV